jgi:predicted heme/steroid binding protein/uncharacterized membrane protein
MKPFDPESLAAFNGKDGRPVYIAHGGKVIDVSASKLWETGTHMKRHPAGRDLTADIAAAPHGPDVLDRYPQVGILGEPKTAEGALPGPLEALLERFPILRRHPHPMVVHFPIVFAVAPAPFYLLFLLTGVAAFETTALHCLGAGLLFWVPAVLTGFLSWWINYQAKPLRAVRIKILFSALLMAMFLAAFLWRLLLPAAVCTVWGGALYPLLLLALIPIAGVIGWFGASLTFPQGKG